MAFLPVVRVSARGRRDRRGRAGRSAPPVRSADRRGKHSRHGPALAESRRGHAVALAEGAREGLVSVVAGVECDCCDAGAGAPETLGGAFRAQAPVQFERRFPDQPAEHTMEVKRRKGGLSRECVEVERLVERAPDVLYRAHHSGLVEGAGLGLHGPTIGRAGAGRLTTLAHLVPMFEPTSWPAPTASSSSSTRSRPCRRRWYSIASRADCTVRTAAR